jgi:hypothetical protein
VAFPAPTTFTSTGGLCCPSNIAAATGDFNGDGKLDAVTIDSGSYLNVMLGNGNGTFQAPISSYIGTANTFYYAIAVGDFNNDKLLDVAIWTLNPSGNTEAGIYLGNGAGSLTFHAAYAAPNSSNFSPGPNSLVTADVNSDGKLDLVGMTPYNGAFVYLGNGDGSFQTPTNYSTGTTAGCCSGVAVGDLNSDGKPDIAISANDGISILLNTGRGTFGAATYYPSGVAGSATGDGIAIGDLNGDKKPDVVVTNENNGAIIYLNQGSGTFAESSTINGVPMGSTGNVLLADINNDKKLDIILVDSFGDLFTFLGKGTGVFSTGPAYPLQSCNDCGNFLALVGDFNNDGTLDLFDTNGGSTSTVALGRGDGSFQTTQLFNYNTNITALNIAVADFNGDGFADVAESLQCCNNKGDIGIVLGSSHGALSTTTTNVVAGCANYNTVWWVATGDVNNDGKADLVATLGDSTQPGCQNHMVAVLTGKGTGKFNAAKYYATGSTAQEFEVYLVDVNGDGKLDIVIENVDGTISVLLNKGTGTYGTATVITSIAALSPFSNLMTFADFNGDGKMDIAVAASPSGGVTSVYVLPGNNNGTFNSPVTTSIPYYIQQSLAAGDFNKDGKQDLLVTFGSCTESPGASYAFLQGNGDGTFTVGSRVCMAPAQSPGIPVVADLNGDGKLDVVIPDYNGDGPTILEGNGDGTFSSPQLFYGGRGVTTVGLGDFNGDGMLDIGLLDSGGFQGVMLNATQPISVSPLTVNYGTVTVSTTKSQTVILTNDQTASLSVTSFTLGGTNPGDFSQTNNCGKTLNAGRDCTITVKFTPTVTGTRSATLTIKDGIGTQTVQLNGTGQ